MISCVISYGLKLVLLSHLLYLIYGHLRFDILHVWIGWVAINIWSEFHVNSNNSVNIIEAFYKSVALGYYC